MKKVVLLTMLLLSQLIYATDNQTKTQRLVASIEADVPSLTLEQLSQISAAAETYMNALASANQQYSHDVKTRIATKASAEERFIEAVESIMTEIQSQQWNSAKEQRKQQIVEQYI